MYKVFDIYTLAWKASTAKVKSKVQINWVIRTASPIPVLRSAPTPMRSIFDFKSGGMESNLFEAMIQLQPTIHGVDKT